VQYFHHEEQLTELTAALKERAPRHCFIKIHEERAQPLLVPFLDGVTTFQDNPENLEWYHGWQLGKCGAFPAAEVDRLIRSAASCFS
jgi:hypothetical protein